MAAILQGERAEGRRASLDEKGVRQYTRVFVVKTNNKNDGSQTVGNAAGLPRRGDAYVAGTDSDVGARCVGLEPRQLDAGGLNWEVTVNYSSKSDSQADNPLARPSEKNFTFAKYQKVFEKDIATGNPVCNSAGDPFDPPIDIDDSRPIITIRRNEASFSGAIAIDYQDAVNTDVFLGFAVGIVKVSNISATSKRENDTDFYEVTYEFECRREGWKIEVLDVGFESLETGGTKKEILDANKNHRSHPAKLNGSGQPLANQGPGFGTFLTFNAYKTKPFAPLGLP